MPAAAAQLGLVGCVQHHGSALGGRAHEERLVLVVPVHDELGGREPRRPRERELPGRGDVGADPSSRKRRSSATLGNAFVP